MAHPAPDGSNDFNNKIIEEFRANEGRVGGLLAGTPIILIHHIGARSGIERITPLACTPRGDSRYLIVASNGGSPTHPDWYYNLKANPRIKVEVGTQTFTVLAEELEGTARAELWPKLVAASSSLGEFETKTARQIPLFVLTREDRPRSERTRHMTAPRSTDAEGRPATDVSKLATRSAT
jgi:deazaflavin-dependent oxidoreductase (nitroreductase family)